MRTILIFVLSLVCNALVFAQKEDYQWPLGGYSSRCNTCLYRFFYDFTTDPPAIVLRDDTITTGHFLGTYSDSFGNILFFSDGFRIFNAQSEMIEDGFGLNPTCPEIQNYRSYPFFQAGFFVGNPRDTTLVYLIHLDYDMYPVNSYMAVGRNLLVTTIKRGIDNSPDRVISKNEILLSGFLQKPAAVRHANGRDWWILVSDVNEGKHYRFLLTPTGISTHMVQEIGSKPSIIDVGTNWNGAGKFSPDGRYYADIHPTNGLALYDFDRCTGLLSNERRVDFYLKTLEREFIGGGGVEFSNDSRYMYISAMDSYKFHSAYPSVMYGRPIQYDLTKAILPLTGDTLTTYRREIRSMYDLNEFMLGMATGPDGRIYITYMGGSYCTIQYPDRKGKSSVFKYNSPDFKNNIYRGIPYLPNYRLGPLDDSPCDTLGLNNVPVANFRMDTPDSTDLQTRYFYNLAHHEPATWRWDFGDGSPNSTDTSALHTYAKPGKYRVCLTVSNRYGEDTYCREVYVGVTAAEEAQATAAAVEIVPNPAGEVVAVYLPDVPASNLPARLSVTDAVGRVVLSRSFSGPWTEVEVRSWPPGVYMVRVEQADGAVRTGKLVVAR